MKNIIIAVPHAIVKNKPLKDEIDDHPFDYAALRAANIMNDVLSISHKTNLFVSHTPRHTHDLNRNEGIDCDFRPKLTKVLKKIKNSKTDSIVLDIHSFPSAHVNLDVYIMDNKGYENKNAGEIVVSSRTFDLSMALIAQGFTATYLPGEKLMSICSEARKYNVSALLIEFNEDLSDKEIRKICNIVKNWLDGDYEDIIIR